MLLRYAVLILCLAAPGCRQDSPGNALEGLDTRTVTLPDGQKVRAEVEIKPQDMARGMMFRESVPDGTGMLFIHSQPGKYPYWMYQVKIPLDILWLDGSRRIVEISEATPPCHTKASECPTFGGHAQARYVLELGAGQVKRHNLRLGDTLAF